MTPNEFADFLAGCFAPIAFLWLVLGFFQQGDELRNSVAALQLQGEELHHSVEQQRQLVEVTRDQLGFEREAKEAIARAEQKEAEPIFHVMGSGTMWSHPVFTSKFTIRNLGRDCRQFSLMDDEGLDMYEPILSHGHGLIIEYQSHVEEEVEPKILKVSCIDEIGRRLNYITILQPEQSEYDAKKWVVAAKDGLFDLINEND